jgi:hypothetical protein
MTLMYFLVNIHINNQTSLNKVNGVVYGRNFLSEQDVMTMSLVCVLLPASGGRGSDCTSFSFNGLSFHLRHKKRKKKKMLCPCKN